MINWIKHAWFQAIYSRTIRKSTSSFGESGWSSSYNIDSTEHMRVYITLLNIHIRICIRGYWNEKSASADVENPTSGTHLTMHVWSDSPYRKFTPDLCSIVFIKFLTDGANILSSYLLIHWSWTIMSSICKYMHQLAVF